MGVRVTGARRTTQWLGNMSATLRAGIQQELNIFGFQLIALAQTRSPVDTGRFRAAWQLFPYHGTNTIAGIMLTNNVPYAGVLEFGSPSGKKPWPSAGPKTTVVSGSVVVYLADRRQAVSWLRCFQILLKTQLSGFYKVLEDEPS